MKKIASIFALGITLFILASCKGDASKLIVGSWKVDPTMIDVVLGESFPEDLRGIVESGKEDMKSEGSEDFEALTIEFQKGGKFLMTAEGEDEQVTGSWKLDGDQLKIDAQIVDEKGSLTLNIEEISKDKVELSLSADDLLNEVKTQMPDLLDEVPSFIDVEAMANGTKFLVGLKK